MSCVLIDGMPATGAGGGATPLIKLSHFTSQVSSPPGFLASNQGIIQAPTGEAGIAWTFFEDRTLALTLLMRSNSVGTIDGDLSLQRSPTPGSPVTIETKTLQFVDNVTIYTIAFLPVAVSAGDILHLFWEGDSNSWVTMALFE
jgi:hypothetical protein